MASGRVHTAVPAMRSTSRTGGADAPLFGVVPTSEWYAARLRPKPTLWQRLLRRQPLFPKAQASAPTPQPGPASPAFPAAGPSPTIAAVEAGGDGAHSAQTDG